MKLYSRTDSQTTRKTLEIFHSVLGNEKMRLIISSIFIPLQHLLYLVILPLLISLYVQSLLEHDFNTPYQTWLVLGMIVSGLASLVAARIGFITMFNHEEAMTTKLSEYAIRGLLSQSHTFFANSKIGALAGEINTFSRSYLSLLDTMFLQASSVIVNFTASLVVVAFVAPIMLPVMIAMTYFTISLSLRSYNLRSPLRNERKELQSKLMGTFGDIIGNQTLVRMFGRKETEIQSVLHQRKKIEDIAKREIQILENGAELRLGVLVAFQIAVLVMCGWLLSIQLLSVAGLVFIVTYLGRVTGSLFAINGVVRTTEQAFLDASKLTDILSRSVEVVDAPNASTLKIAKADIEFRDVNFAYSEAKDQAIFQDFNLVIPNHQSIGLVGRSGGGKSTLTQLILRYMDIQSGEILINNRDISLVTQDSLRKHISYVPQDPYLFHRTLRGNISYGKEDASDADIERAAKQAYAMEFITKLPDGLDTVVGERGVKLSGGQRQRIAIARAILKDAPILLLDEATSALDSESEMYIQKALGQLMKGRTNIVIAHRLSTIAKLDRIIVLDDGKIVEDGTHTVLLKKGGTYAKLWNHQSGGFIEE